MKFKVGDIIKGKRNVYGITNINMYKAEVVTALSNSTEMRIKVLEHRRSEVVGNVYEVKNSSQDFELLPGTKITEIDLKDGDIVTYRNGEKKTVVRTEKNNTLYVEKASKSNNEFDIVKIERPVGYETLFEKEEEILDNTEKRYLGNFIRPFKVVNIKKASTGIADGYEFIRIAISGDLGIESIALPYFKLGTMYKGMEAHKEYTLEELGL